MKRLFFVMLALVCVCLGTGIRAEGEGEEMRDAAGRPRLRMTGDGVADRDLEGGPLDPGEALGEAVVLEVCRRLDE